MKQLFLTLSAATAILGLTPLAVQAAPWQSINQRQVNLDRRIDQGVASGALTRPEAVRLRSEFRNLARLEARYRRTGGLSVAERRDLDQKFDRLSRRVRVQKHNRRMR